MNFEQFRAKVFMLTIWKELDQPLDKEIDELKKEFGIKELEGIKILASLL